MTDDYDWLIGAAATYQPVGSDEHSTVGEIVAIRDDHPDPDAESIRVVLRVDGRLVDVDKSRVHLE